MDFIKFTPHIRKEITKIYKMYGVAVKYKAKEVLKDDALAEDW